jgi:nitrile hydratase accessory protein
MSQSPDRLIANMEGPDALPRKNGELVFEAPWEGRAFGIAVALSEGGRYPWEDFRQELIGQIAAAESRGDATSYYERWLAGLERLLLERGLLTEAELDARAAAIASGEREDVF